MKSIAASAARRHDPALVISTYIDVACELFPRHFTAACCLNGTRVFVEVCKHFGMSVQPVVVELMACNAKWLEKIVAKGGHPESQDESDAWVAEGAHSLGVAASDNQPEGWPHHLIALSNGHLVDSSAGQVSRPKKGIVVPFALATPCAPGFVASHRVEELRHPNGAAMYYKAVSGVEYAKRAGWQLSSWNRDIAQSAIELIEGQL